MANSERDILAKIGDILLEINEDYSNLQQKSEGEQDTVSLFLLTAKTKQLTAYFEAWEKIGNSKSSARLDNDVPTGGEPATDKSSGEVERAEQKASDDEVSEQVENVAQEYQHGDPEPKLQEVEDSDEFVPEVDQERPEEEGEDDDRFISSETVDHWKDTEEDVIQAEEEPKSEVDDEEATEEEQPDNVTEIEDEPVDEDIEKESDSDAEEVVEEEQPDLVTETAEEDESLSESEEPTSQEPIVVQESRSEQPKVTQVVEEERKVAIEQPIAPAPEEKPSRPLTLNEIIQQQKKEGLTHANQFHTTAQSERVLDLKTAVSLNDKLLFIKDLFNGYSLAYSEAIELLNRFDNFAEADVFLQTNYAIKNNWVSKPQTVEKLYAILRKKFI